MALINYVEPISIGEIFVGIGALVFMLVFAWIIYRIYKRCILWLDSQCNRDEKYSLLEEVMLDKMAKEKGIDLDKELMKRDMLRKPESKSIRKKIKDKVYEDFFGKEEPKTKK